MIFVECSLSLKVVLMDMEEIYAPWTDVMIFFMKSIIAQQ